MIDEDDICFISIIVGIIIFEVLYASASPL